MRLYVLVEGETEREFVTHVLEPHLRVRELWVYPIIVETSRNAYGRKRRGGGRWKNWLRDLRHLTAEHSGADVRFTTMFDLYGLPGDFPALDEHAKDSDTARRVKKLEQAMAEVVGDHRFVPNLLRHEFESLVLASLDALSLLFETEEDLRGVNTLRAIVATTAPEEINDGAETAPSKRLAALVPGYRKTVHGPLATFETGLESLRRMCPRFDSWVGRLEVLAA